MNVCPIMDITLVILSHPSHVIPTQYSVSYHLVLLKLTRIRCSKYNQIIQVLREVLLRPVPCSIIETIKPSELACLLPNTNRIIYLRQ